MLRRIGRPKAEALGYLEAGVVTALEATALEEAAGFAFAAG
jgi:hypothetical protein